MGIVYRATDLDLERQVALKLLSDRVSSPDARERFIREARAAAALIEALLALGRREEAITRPAAYGEMVSDCQSAHFSREVSRLEGLLR